MLASVTRAPTSAGPTAHPAAGPTSSRTRGTAATRSACWNGWCAADRGEVGFLPPLRTYW